MLKKISSLLLILFINTQTSYAHPHLFIDMDATLNIYNNKLTSIDYQWTFDEMFSATIFMDYDTNKDSFFDKKETQKIYEEAFSNLSNFNYFTYIENQKFKTVDNFSVNKTAGIFPYEDLQGIFGEKYAEKIFNYLKQNNYLGQDNAMGNNYLLNLSTIFGWIKNNYKEDGPHIIDFLKSSASYKVTYKFSIPTNIIINNTTLLVRDETNYTAPDLKNITLSDSNYTYSLKRNKLVIKAQ